MAERLQGDANFSLDAAAVSGGVGGQELNHTSLLDMFSGMELLLRFKPLFLPLYCLLVGVASVGNCFLLVCILADKKLHNATNFFIGNLAAGDLLMCLSCVPLTASYALDRHGWTFGIPLCHLRPLLQCATVFASALSLTAIAVDRYVVVGMERATGGQSLLVVSCADDHSFKCLKGPYYSTSRERD